MFEKNKTGRLKYYQFILTVTKKLFTKNVKLKKRFSGKKNDFLMFEGQIHSLDKLLEKTL